MKIWKSFKSQAVNAPFQPKKGVYATFKGIKIVINILFTFCSESLFLYSTIADNVGVMVSSVTMIGPRL